MIRVLGMAILMASLVPASSWGGTLRGMKTSLGSPRTCQVEPGWWSSFTREGDVLDFHVTPDGTQVDTVHFALHDMCGFAGLEITSYGPTGVLIDGDPCGFIWQSDCSPSFPPSHGYEIRVEFGTNGCEGGQDSVAELDLTLPQTGCPLCVTLPFFLCPTPVEVMSWGYIKTMYR
jgi:hypothetical protein